MSSNKLFLVSNLWWVFFFFSKKKGVGSNFVFPKNKSLFHVRGSGENGSAVEPRCRVCSPAVPPARRSKLGWMSPCTGLAKKGRMRSGTEGRGFGDRGTSHGSGNPERRDGINKICVFSSELSPSLKEKCQRLVSDCNLGWESRGCCAFDNLWEKLPGEFLDPRAPVDSILDLPEGPQEGKREPWPGVGVLNSAPSATSSLSANSRRAAGKPTLLGETASRAAGFGPS